MAITHDAGNKWLIVTGYSEVTPASLADIQAANDAGGWGAITNPNNTLYYTTAEYFIKISANSFLAINEDEALVLVGTGNNGAIWLMAATSHLRLGKQTTMNGMMIPSGGPMIIGRTPAGALGRARIYNQSNGIIKCYGCVVDASRYGTTNFGNNPLTYVDGYFSTNEGAININGGGTIKNVYAHNWSVVVQSPATNMDRIVCKTLYHNGNLSATYRNCEVSGTVQNAKGNTMSLVDCTLATGVTRQNDNAAGVQRDQWSWQPTFHLGSTAGPVIQNLDVKLVDGKGITKYASAGYGGGDAKTDVNGQLDFLTAGIGAIADTARLIEQTFTGTSETLDDGFKDHLVYAKKDGLIELSGAKLIMDRVRLNSPVYVLPKSAMSYPAGIAIGETGRVNVVKEPSAIKVVR